MPDAQAGDFVDWRRSYRRCSFLGTTWLIDTYWGPFSRTLHALPGNRSSYAALHELGRLLIHRHSYGSRPTRRSDAPTQSKYVLCEGDRLLGRPIPTTVDCQGGPRQFSHWTGGSDLFDVGQFKSECQRAGLQTGRVDARPAAFSLSRKSSLADVDGFVPSLSSSPYLFWRDTGYFEQSADLISLLHSWTLSLESQVYAVGMGLQC